MIKKFPLLILFLVLFLAHSWNARAMGRGLTIAATPRTISNFTAFTQGQPAFEIQEYASPDSTRQVVVIVMILKALKISGFHETDIVFKEVPNSARERAVVKSGNALIGEQGHWRFHFDDTVYRTDPVVRNGEFEKGIYIDPKPSTYKLLYVDSVRQLQNHTAVMVPTWVTDWETLKTMGPERLDSAATAPILFRMLRAGRAEFTLYEFSTREDFSQTIEGITLLPVPGIKVGLRGSRHLMVSKRHPMGKQVYEALQKGLKVLRRNGEIKRALTECGFIDQRVAHWKKIN